MDLRENRVHQRVDVTIDVKIVTKKSRYIGKLKNLSKGGAGLEISENIGREKDQLELQIPLPGEIEITVTSEIVRVQEKDGTYFYGLRFDSIDNSLQSHLLTLIETLLKHSAGDQRKFPRVYRRIPIRYKHLSELEAVLENISMGGLSMIVDRPHILYDPIEISVPDLRGREFLILQGKVIHQLPMPLSSPPKFRIGIEFDELADIEKKCLHEFILHILDLKKSLPA